MKFFNLIIFTYKLSTFNFILTNICDGEKSDPKFIIDLLIACQIFTKYARTKK